MEYKNLGQVHNLSFIIWPSLFFIIIIIYTQRIRMAS